MAYMPLFKSKSKFTLEEQMLQIRGKEDKKLTSSRANFIEIAAKSEGKISIEKVKLEFDHAEQRLIEHRLWLDGEAAELRRKRDELATLTNISEKEHRIKEKEFLNDEIRILKDEKASAYVVRNQAESSIREDKIAMHTANQKEIRAHNKRVLGEWVEEVSDIGNDFLDEQRQISERNRNRRNDD